jgi:hypothetical protein
MASILGRARLTAAESFWYVLGCIAFGGMYFAKVPVKKAFSEAGLAELTGAEHFWYILMCIAFGAGYFAKVPVKKALTETSQIRDLGDYDDAPQLDQGGGRGAARHGGQPASLDPSPSGHRRPRHDGRDQQPW